MEQGYFFPWVCLNEENIRQHKNIEEDTDSREIKLDMLLIALPIKVIIAT